MADALPPSHPPYGRRFLSGLAAALLLGVGFGALLLGASRGSEGREREERRAVVTLLALSQVLDRVQSGGAPAEESTGGGMSLAGELAAATAPEPAAVDPGEAMRRAVAAFAASHPELEAIRVVAFEGIRLEASTDPRDTEERTAPRRLERDEKPLYDLGQSLRAAVAGNREGLGGAARQEEIAVERLPGGGLRLTAPVERNGEAVGMVQMETAPAAGTGIPGRSPLEVYGPALAAWLLPVVLFSLLARFLGDRRGILATVAVVLLLAGLAAYAWHARRILEADRRATAAAVNEAVGQEGQRAGALLAELGLPAGPALEAWRWDVSLYREPLGLISAEGGVDEGRLGEEIGASAGRLTRSGMVLALVSLALLAFVGWGWAARTGTALVEYRQAYAYTLPALFGMVLLVFFPFLYGLALSFTNANIYNTDASYFDTWVGLSNFLDILRDVSVTHRTPEGTAWDYTNFYWTLGFTLAWTVSNVAVGVTLGLLLALALNTPGLAFRPVYRVLLILPWAMPTYITALIWRGMFHKQFGVMNQIFQMVGAEPVAWFEGPLTSFLAVLTTNGWLSFPFMMVVSLGALQSIPADLYEAARVDGASRWQQFRAITLPSLRPALIPAIILSVIWTFNQFNVIYLVSAGQPGGATEILITQAYKLAFEQYRYGYAAAYSVIIFLILLVYGVFQNRATRATESIG